MPIASNPGSGRGGSYGGSSGFGGGYGGQGDENKKKKSGVWGEVGKWTFDAMTGLMVPTAAVNAGLFGLTGETIGDQVAKAISGPWGTAPPGPLIGAPGTTSGGQDGVGVPSVPAPIPAEAPPPLLVPEPNFAQIEKEKRRKRFGRQQTIVAGRLGLSDDVYKPTLLGA